LRVSSREGRKIDQEHAAAPIGCLTDNGSHPMKTAAYKIDRHPDGWGVEHDGRVTATYDTKEAAFEAAVLPASNAIKLGYAVSITVAGSQGQEPALGAG
jgi:hypothetical protein